MNIYPNKYAYFSRFYIQVVCRHSQAVWKKGMLVRCLMQRLDFYEQTTILSSTKYQNLNVSGIVLQMSMPNPLKPGVKWRMKM